MSSWILAAEANPKATVKLFCLAYAGGGAEMFVPWRKLLPAHIDVCPVQLPGRGSRMLDTPIRQRDRLAAELAGVLLEHGGENYALFGHSMGALLWFDTCRVMMAQDFRMPSQLMVAGERAPQKPNRDTPIYQLSDADFRQAVKSYNGPTLGAAGDELLQMIMPALRADFAICDTYEYTDHVPLNCPITAIGGFDDDTVEWNELLAWDVQTSATFSCRMIDGGHFFPMERAKETAAVISDVLRVEPSP
ncbi:MAG TPA: thioesterase [Chromatiaceae bacterium]|nr:thioesterase [Chromatiaceae bacterium]HIB83396.1 thioesterase [Chromatiaceae bacterium]